MESADQYITLQCSPLALVMQVMAPKGTTVTGKKPAPAWWEYAVLDLWLAEDRPEYRSVALGGFHQRAKDMIEEAYSDLLPFEVPTHNIS